MASLNKVIIMGNLGQDPEIRYTQNQVAVTTLNVATTESWNKDGQKQEQTEWHRIIVWNKQAENCAKYLSKGRSVLVEGKLQTRSWEDKNGQKRYTTEITASSVQFLSSGGANPSSNSDFGQRGQNSPENDFPPVDKQDFSQKQGNSGFNTESLDDIPF